PRERGEPRHHHGGRAEERSRPRRAGEGSPTERRGHTESRRRERKPRVGPPGGTGPAPAAKGRLHQRGDRRWHGTRGSEKASGPALQAARRGSDTDRGGHL